VIVELSAAIFEVGWVQT